VDIDNPVFGRQQGGVEAERVELWEPQASGLVAEELRSDIVFAHAAGDVAEGVDVAAGGDQEAAGGTKEVLRALVEGSDCGGGADGQASEGWVGFGLAQHSGVASRGMCAEQWLTFEEHAVANAIASEGPGGGDSGKAAADHDYVDGGHGTLWQASRRDDQGSEGGSSAAGSFMAALWERWVATARHSLERP
jgi:hypothetical protein